MQIHAVRVLSLAVKWLVMLVTVAMALDHLGIGRGILLLAFGILFGGIVFAAALAVGLGARDVVGRALERQLFTATNTRRRRWSALASWAITRRGRSHVMGTTPPQWR